MFDHTTRLRLLDPLLTLVAIYAIQYVLCALFVVGNAPQLLRPFSWLPSYLYFGWDSWFYRELYRSFDVYVWPPLYPFTLRLITAIFQFAPENAFSKSAIILNTVSHIVIAFGISAYIRNDERLKGVAPWVVTFLLLLYPGHNVYFAAYAESYYLALTIVALLLRQRGWLGPASIVAGVSSLARIMGAFLTLALFVEQVFYCIRDRKIYWRKLVLSGSGLAIVAAWQITLRAMGTSSVAAGADWVKELVTNHVPPGMNPKLWVLQYVAFSTNVEMLAFWGSVAAMVYCAVKKRYAELFYVAMFNLSMAFYVYRPFPWTRYVSVLFPLQIMAADWLKNKPRLTCALLIIAAVVSCYLQRELFLGKRGEP